jgi:hypothetical protein
VAGPAGDPAVRLTESNDEIILAQGDNSALVFDLADSFTAEVELRTTDSSGVIIGSRPSVKNWTLQVAGGHVQFSLFDGVNTPTITSTAAVNDGNWHRIVAVRDAGNHVLKLYIDGVSAASNVTDTTTQPRTPSDPLDPVLLGAYNDTSAASQLAADVDMVRITRSALPPASFLPANFVSPTPPPSTLVAGNAPTSIAGLQLWLPAYDPQRYFAAINYVDSLPLAPFDGMATRSLLDGSSNRLGVSAVTQLRQVLYQSDAAIGPYWSFDASGGATLGNPLRVTGSSGSSSTNFNFVQNTGVFTLSTFVNIGAATGGPMTLFDTNEALTTLAGFSLMRDTDGSLRLVIGGGTSQTVRFNNTAPSGAELSAGTWYHVAVVGSGPGNPVQFYVTPLSASSVTRYDSVNPLAGPNGTYLTDTSHDLLIGGRSNTAISGDSSSAGAAPLNGGMVNQAIFNTALSAAQIQQLFLYGKGYAGVNVAAVQRQPYNGPVATFKAASPTAHPSDYSAAINWGDSHVTAGAITVSDGVVTVSGANTYASAGSFPITVTITDHVAATTVDVITSAIVAPSLQASALSVSAVTGRALTALVSSFTDADPSPSSNYSATINWGDGQQSSGAILMSGGVYNVVGSHTYSAAGTFLTSVTINDAADGDSAAPTNTATVVDPIVANAVAISSLTGDVFNGAVATFTDVDSGTTPANYSASINWGDGNVTSGSISLAGGVFTVSGTHTYAAPAIYSTSISVQDLGDGDSDVAGGSATVQNAMTASGINLIAVVGYAFNGAVASFTTPSPGTPPANFSASINWGDGSVTAGTVSLAAGVYKVSGAHTYSAPGNLAVNTTINDSSGHTVIPGSTATVSSTTQIAARRMFYLRSPKYDVTNSNLPGFSDDNAIAPDKTAYLPGSGTSSFASVSSYSRGINGVMVDIVGGHGTITAADFVFKIGNNNSPSLWATATGPTLVTVRAGAGVGSSDRIELLWADGAIQKQWLEVIVRGNDALGGSNSNTALAASDAFFFGSAPGDSGAADSSAFSVTSADEIAARNDPHGIGNPAAISNTNDFNRDGLVNSTDQVFARNNGTNLGNQLKFLVVGAGGPFAPNSSPMATSDAAPPLRTAQTTASTADAGIATALAVGVSAPRIPSATPPPSAPVAELRRSAVDAYFERAVADDPWLAASEEDAQDRGDPQESDDLTLDYPLTSAR